jgi:hypothetical protein
MTFLAVLQLDLFDTVGTLLSTGLALGDRSPHSHGDRGTQCA